jgi:hypothetical protein
MFIKHYMSYLLLNKNYSQTLWSKIKISIYHLIQCPWVRHSGVWWFSCSQDSMGQQPTEGLTGAEGSISKMAPSHGSWQEVFIGGLTSQCHLRPRMILIVLASTLWFILPFPKKVTYVYSCMVFSACFLPAHVWGSRSHFGFCTISAAFNTGWP